MNIIEDNTFAKSYKKPKKLLEDNPFYLEILNECHENKKQWEFIIASNDIHEITPVETFLKLYDKRIREYLAENKEQSTDIREIKQSIGAYLGFIMLHKEGYKKSCIKRVFKGNALGVSTATLFKKEESKGEDLSKKENE